MNFGETQYTHEMPAVDEPTVSNSTETWSLPPEVAQSTASPLISATVLVATIWLTWMFVEWRERAAYRRLVGEIRAETSSNDMMVRVAAVRILGKLGEHGDLAVPALQELLEHPDEYVRREAANSLGHLGTKARTAIPLLTKARRSDESAEVRRVAEASTEQIREASSPQSISVWLLRLAIAAVVAGWIWGGVRRFVGNVVPPELRYQMQ